MDMKQLEAFVQVAQTHSFSQAASVLHLTQPTVSSRIASLEQELQVQLLRRPSAVLSEAGEVLYGYAREILELRARSLEALGALSGQIRGTVTVAASTIPGQYFLPRLLQSFRASYPEVSFDVRLMDSAEAAGQVLSRSAEIGFTGTLPEHPKCLCRPFADDRLVVITPNQPRFRQYADGGFPAEQLLRESYISREPGSGTRTETEHFLRQLGVDPDQLPTAVEVRSTESLKKMVSEGVGVAILSHSACEDYCQFEKLLAFDFRGAVLRRRLYLLRRKGGLLSPAALAFYDYAKGFYHPAADPASPE
nr:selenium metabolism-associated LysR family transcriptional regulator [uncultured Dysosmobacter sp.]